MLKKKKRAFSKQLHFMQYNIITENTEIIVLYPIVTISNKRNYNIIYM